MGGASSSSSSADRPMVVASAEGGGGGCGGSALVAHPKAISRPPFASDLVIALLTIVSVFCSSSAVASRASLAIPSSPHPSLFNSSSPLFLLLECGARRRLLISTYPQSPRTPTAICAHEVLFREAPIDFYTRSNDGDISSVEVGPLLATIACVHWSSTEMSSQG